MRFIVYNGPDIINVINMLDNSGYSLSNFNNYFTFIFAAENYKVLIDAESKTFTLFISTNEILSIVKGRDVKTISNTTSLMEYLGISNINTIHDAMRPGYYVVLNNGDETFYGVILDVSHILCFNAQGQMIKYIVKYTDDKPDKIMKICKPSDKFFKAKDIDNMEIVWERHKLKVKKSIADIEKALNLEPGTLEIL